MLLPEPIQNILMRTADGFFKIWPGSYKTKNFELLTGAKWVAHRCFYHSQQSEVENTQDALLKCIDLKANAVEVDLRWTSDAKPVIYHDQDLHRIHGVEKKIAELTFEQISVLKPNVMCLESLACTLKKSSVSLFLELKGSPTDYSFVGPQLMAQYLKSIHEHVDLKIMCFNLDWIEYLSEIDSKIFWAIAESNVNLILNRAIKLNIGGVSGHYLMIQDFHIKRAQSFGLEVGTGFINSLNLAKREIDRGVNYLFTNEFKKIIDDVNL